MKIEPYTLTVDSHKLRYRFTSLGVDKSNQAKLIEFQSVPEYLGVISTYEYFQNCDSIFNLAFGDTDSNGNIDDYARTNNGDMLIVLRTVAFAVESFLLEHPNAVIVFRGSTAGRTRLYRIQMSKFYQDISDRFVIFSAHNGVLDIFKPDMKADAFFY